MLLIFLNVLTFLRFAPRHHPRIRATFADRPPDKLFMAQRRTNVAARGRVEREKLESASGWQPDQLLCYNLAYL